MRARSSWVSAWRISPAPRGAAASRGPTAAGETSAAAAAAEPAAAEAAEPAPDIGTAITPEAPAVPQEQHQEEHDEDDVDRERQDRQRVALPAPGRLLRRDGRRITAEHADDRGGAREHAAVEVAALEGGDDVA